MDDFMMDDGYQMGNGADLKSAGRWTAEEHSLFLQGLKKYNKQWKYIAELVKTRTVVQIRTHAQKYFQKLAKMKDGKISNKPTTLVAYESLMMDGEDTKSGSRTSSISSAESMDQDDDRAISDGEQDGGDFTHGISLPPESPSRKRTRERRSSSISKSAVSTPRRSGRAPKRPNLNSGYYYPHLSEASAERPGSPEDWFLLPSVVADEGMELDESIVNLLERIDWSLSPTSRSHSPFMDSAASVSSNLDTIGMEVFNMLDFPGNTDHADDLTVDASTDPVALDLLSTPAPAASTAAPRDVPLSMAQELTRTKERVAFSCVMREFEQVFGKYKIGAYDRLPSIRTLLSMKSSNLAVASFTGSLTPSHSTFCHFPLADDDTTDLLLEDELLLSGHTTTTSAPTLLLPPRLHLDYTVNPASSAAPFLVLPPAFATGTSSSVPTPRRRGRPRKHHPRTLVPSESQTSLCDL